MVVEIVPLTETLFHADTLGIFQIAITLLEYCYQLGIRGRQKAYKLSKIFNDRLITNKTTKAKHLNEWA